MEVHSNVRKLEEELRDVVGDAPHWSTAYAADRDGVIRHVGRYGDAEDALRRGAFHEIFWGVMHGTSDGESLRIRKLAGYDHPVLRETRLVFNSKRERYEKKEEKDKGYSTLTLGVEC